MSDELSKQVAQGTYRAPGFVIADEQGYSLELALESVGPGWAPLIECLFYYINAPKGYWGNQVDTPVKVRQVKEKFGDLRFYYDGGDDFFRGAVAMAEHLSGYICEVCGKPGEARPGGYILTLCDEHDAQHKAGKRMWEMLEEVRKDAG